MGEKLGTGLQLATRHMGRPTGRSSLEGERMRQNEKGRKAQVDTQRQEDGRRKND